MKRTVSVEIHRKTEMNEENEALPRNYVELHCPSLHELFQASGELCERLGVEFNTKRIMVSTDYGIRVVITYQDEEIEGGD